MPEKDHLLLGWAETGNVSDLTYIAMHQPGLFMRFDHVLISTLDSDRNPHVNTPAFAEIIDSELFAASNYIRGIVTSGAMIVELAVKQHLFNDFDEVWFFNELPGAPPPESSYLFTREWFIGADEESNSVDSEMSQLLQWQRQEKAVLGVSDGIGFSYSTSDATLHSALKAMLRDLA